MKWQKKKFWILKKNKGYINAIKDWRKTQKRNFERKEAKIKRKMIYKIMQKKLKNFEEMNWYGTKKIYNINYWMIKRK